MPEYRLYKLHPDSGHIVAAEDIEAADDHSALHAIHLLGHSVPVELWSGKRKICHVDPVPQAAAFWPNPLIKPLDEALG